MKCACLAFVVLAMFLGTCHATKFAFTGNYKLIFNTPEAGFVKGTVYYYLDDEQLTDSRILFATNEPVEFKQMYHYENKGIYNLCDRCTASSLGTTPETWWKTSKDSHCSDAGDGYFKCNRDAVGSTAVAEFVSKGKPGDSDFDIKYVLFNDDRKLSFVSKPTVVKYDNIKKRFELPKKDGKNLCPTPTCRSKMDVVFVMDNSESVDSSEFRQSMDFVKMMVGNFTLSRDGVYVGLVQYSAPDDKSCKKHVHNGCHWGDYYYDCDKGWYAVACEDPTVQASKVDIINKKNKPDSRLIADCLFDTKCDNCGVGKVCDGDYKAKIAVELGYDQIMNEIDKVTQIPGHTCQRYGLEKAYEMLFERNPRGDDKPTPTPVVIVVTDGADLCHTSTEEWANKIKAKDDRALLLEVGVGLQADFDEEYIKNLSSTLDMYESALNVDNYTEIGTIISRLVTQTCELSEQSSGCANCNGFCACAKCVCPLCDEEKKSCKYRNCMDGFNGCLERTVECNNQTLMESKCYNQNCDPSTSECVVEKIECTRPAHLKECQRFECVNKKGCNERYGIVNDHEFCKAKAKPCEEAACNPLDSNAQPDGCVFTSKCKALEENPHCHDVHCLENNECDATCVDDPCLEYVDGHVKDRCPPVPCKVLKGCITDEHGNFDRCDYENKTCDDKESENICRLYQCENDECKYRPLDPCSSLGSFFCVSYYCDENANEGRGACVAVNATHAEDNCYDYTCSEELRDWIVTPKCTTDLACKVARCNYEDGSCHEDDLNCFDRVEITDNCFQATCKEPTGCYKTQYRGAYFDVCGNCIRGISMGDDSAVDEVATDCVTAPDEELKTEGLAAAAIALIIVGAIIIGAAIMFSGIMGTKALIDRARGAANQSVVSNPLFEDSQTEMSNPGFLGETI